MLLIDDILLLPLKLFSETCEKIREMADEQRIITPDSVKRKLLEAQTDYEEGKISEMEYREAIEFLSARLEAIMKSRGERKR